MLQFTQYYAILQGVIELSVTLFNVVAPETLVTSDTVWNEFERPF